LIRGQTVLVNLQSFLLPMLCSDGIPEEMRGLRNWAALLSMVYIMVQDGAAQLYVGL
jgi:hypothetical protein